MPKTTRQPSRKNKSSWRKNIDLEKVEQNLERKRAAERVGEDLIHGGTESSSIFIEDRKGDEGLDSVVRAKKRGLKSLEILNNISKATGLMSRAKRGIALEKNSSGSNGIVKAKSTSGGLTPEQRAIRAGMSKKDIEKLRRVAGRDVKGAFGVIVEEDLPTKRGVEALIGTSTYDVWNQGQSSDSKGKKKSADIKENDDDDEGWGEVNKSKDIQLPASLLDATKKSKSKSLSLPDPGQSYNPAAEAHEELLNRAIRDVQKEEERRQKEMEWKKTWDQGAKQARGKGEDEIEDMLGLKVGQGEVDLEPSGDESEDEDDLESETEGVGREIKRKTKQQKAKAKKLKEETRARMALKASKRSMSDIQSLRSLKKQLMAVEREKLEAAEKRRQARERRRNGRVGVYKLPNKEEEVQLGEDLAEGLRLLKPEGNLLHDRSHSFQKHGIVEPKRRDTLSKRRGRSMRGKKEYETHAYKRFS